MTVFGSIAIVNVAKFTSTILTKNFV